MELKGKLVRWFDDRGFGFIKISSSEEEIFIHITALKNMPRRPVVGDIIYFQVEHEHDGKARAKSARIEGLARTSRTIGRSKNSPIELLVSIFFGIFLVGILSFFIYFSFIFEEDFTGYKCEGKRYCSEMTCKEARFYVKNCPNVEIDGDGDGKPCEQQCGH